MIKVFLFVFIFFTSMLFSQEKPFDYMGIGVTKQTVDNKAFNSGKVLTINTGRNNVYNNLGLEIEGNIQINKPEANIKGISSDLKFWSMGMYGTYLWKMSDLTIKPRVGLVYESIKSSFNIKNTNPLSPVDKNKLAISGGIGISYKITNKTKIFTNYTKFEDDIEHLTFGAEFKF